MIEWNPDLFWGLFIGTFGFGLIFFLCFWVAEFTTGRIDKISRDNSAREDKK